MSDIDRQAITTPAEYAALLFQWHEIKLREAEKRLTQRKARDTAMKKILELTKIQMRLCKRSEIHGCK